MTDTCRRSFPTVGTSLFDTVFRIYRNISEFSYFLRWRFAGSTRCDCVISFTTGRDSDSRRSVSMSKLRCLARSQSATGITFALSHVVSGSPFRCAGVPRDFHSPIPLPRSNAWPASRPSLPRDFRSREPEPPAAAITPQTSFVTALPWTARAELGREDVARSLIDGTTGRVIPGE